MKTQIRASVEAYVTAWNTEEPARRRALLAGACADDLRIEAPGQTVRGREELDALIEDFHRRRPGDRGTLSSAIEVHGHLFRFAARIEGGTAAPPVEMLDAGECAEDGRIRLILSFVGAAPPPIG